MIPVDEALARLLEGATPLDAEIVAFDRAGGRILAEAIVAARTHPPFAASAMDGYAVRAGDVAKIPVRLRVIGESAAGRRFNGMIGPGQAARIFTGAPLPDGADAILIQEDAERTGNTVTALRPVAVGQHLRPRGLDFRQGDVLLEPGRLIDAAALALMGAADATAIPVVRRPLVSIVATGNELVEPGHARSDDQIVGSNTYGIARIVQEAGGEAVNRGIVGDDEHAIGAVIDQAIDARSDIVVVLGGASVGDYDLTAKVFVQKGVELAFSKVAMRPGRPMMAGRLGRTHLLGIPGNPVSALVCAHLFLRPLIACLLGAETPADMMTARLVNPLPANGPRQDYMRAVAHTDSSGTLVDALPVQDSSMLKSLATANALIVRPPHAGPAPAGALCNIVVLRSIS